MSHHDYYSRPPRSSLAPFVWAVVLLGVLALVLVWRFWPHHGPELNPHAVERTVAPRGSLAEAEKAAIELYKDAAPSVANVTSLSVRRDRFNLNLQQIPKGTGTGIVWDQEGHVVTNYHVIDGAGAVRVTLADHSSWPVQRVASDPNMDLAVLWIGAPKSRLKPIAVGTSHNLKVGQWAFAIGNPFGLDQSLAPGFVSALGREIESAGGTPIKNAIQTTAPINPGNSGGPLLDSAGRLIGVNTAILSPSGAWAGIGFAIPVDAVNRTVTQLIQHGEVVRAGLGIDPAPDQVARQVGIRNGVLILNVYKNSAAANAGLRPTYRDEDGNIILGDVIRKVEGHPVRTGKELYAALAGKRVGDQVTLAIERQDPDTGEWRRQDVKVTLTEVAK